MNRLEGIERFAVALNIDTGDPEMDPSPTGRYVLLSDVLNTLTEQGGERAGLAKKLREGALTDEGWRALGLDFRWPDETGPHEKLLYVCSRCGLTTDALHKDASLPTCADGGDHELVEVRVVPAASVQARAADLLSPPPNRLSRDDGELRDKTLSRAEAVAARIALADTYRIEADDEPNPNAATRAFRKLSQAALVEGGSDAQD